MEGIVDDIVDGDQFRCFVARFDFVDSITDSVTLMLDTRNVRVLGDGVIDLDDETLQLDFAPRAKRRRLVRLSTPFSIAGPLSSPRLQISTVGAAGRTVGEAVLSVGEVTFTPVGLLGRLFPLVSDHDQDVDNPCLKP